jgi:hypothetical protein
MKSRSTLFLMEQIIVIAVFAICAAVCVKILAVSYLMTQDSADTRRALLIAENAAESHIAFHGDTAQVVRLLAGGVGAVYDEQSVRIFFDKNAEPCSESDAAFVLSMEMKRDESGVIFSDITVTRLWDDGELVRLTAAARRSD